MIGRLYDKYKLETKTKYRRILLKSMIDRHEESNFQTHLRGCRLADNKAEDDESRRMIMPKKGEILLEVQDMCKNFGETRALRGVAFQAKAGEIRGLIGENGSGKSTLTSIMAGMQPATSGSMTYHGKPWKPSTVLEGLKAGIGMVVQETGTLGDITVAENLFLGEYDQFKTHMVISRKKMNEEAKKALSRVGLGDVNPARPVRLLDMQTRKLIELARVMNHDPDILVVDETTTALGQSGREILYKVMHDMAAGGRSVIIVSHDLEEMMEHCDTLTILRDGEIIDNLAREQYEPNLIKRLMVGREIKGNYYRVDNDGYEETVVLKADYISTLEELLCVKMELHKGEILGIGGLSDCGMHTLGHALYGLEEVLDGEVTLTEKGVKVTDAITAYQNKMGYVSKDRDNESLEQNASIFANIASTGYRVNRWFGPFISQKKESEYVEKQIEGLLIKCSGPHQQVKTLSGGNKQKVVFGKWVAYDSDILILDCPTRGVDVGVKAAMYQLIYDMKTQGKSIIMISEEMPELIGMSDRILIMKDGKITGEFFRQNGFSEHDLIECMI